MSVKVHEAFSIDSFQDRLLWYDDFLGDQIKDEWRVAGSSTADVVDAQTGGIIRINSGAVLWNNTTMNWTDLRSLLVTKKATMETRLKLTQTSDVGVKAELTANLNDDRLAFDYESTGANWRIICANGGVPTIQDSGITADTAYHIFRIEAFPTGQVHFYIDDVETANSPITTNIPPDYLQPVFWIQARAASNKTLDIDYVVIRQEI